MLHKKPYFLEIKGIFIENPGFYLDPMPSIGDFDEKVLFGKIFKVLVLPGLERECPFLSKSFFKKIKAHAFEYNIWFMTEKYHDNPKKLFKRFIINPW